MLRIDTQRTPWPEDRTTPAWTGVLKRDGHTVATCGHPHQNRITLAVPVDNALDCITIAVRAVRDPGVLTGHFHHLLRAGDADDPGFGTPGHRGADAVRDEATGQVTVIAQAARDLAPVIGDQPVWGPGGFLAIPPGPPMVPCHGCGVRLVARRWRPGDGGWTDWAPVPGPAGRAHDATGPAADPATGPTAQPGLGARCAAPPAALPAAPVDQPPVTPPVTSVAAFGAALNLMANDLVPGARRLCTGGVPHVPACPYGDGTRSSESGEME